MNYFTATGKLSTKATATLSKHMKNLILDVQRNNPDMRSHLATVSEFSKHLIKKNKSGKFIVEYPIGTATMCLTYATNDAAQADRVALNNITIAALKDKRIAAEQIIGHIGGLVICRYSTPDNSWMSVYMTSDIAKIHVGNNVESHFDARGEEMPEDYESEIASAFNQCDSVIEFGDFNVEIEYNEKVYTK